MFHISLKSGFHTTRKQQYLTERFRSEASSTDLHSSKIFIAEKNVETISKFLHHPKRESLQILFARTGVIDFLIMFIFDAKVKLNDNFTS